jgi:hypothetical protein
MSADICESKYISVEWTQITNKEIDSSTNTSRSLYFGAISFDDNRDAIILAIKLGFDHYKRFNLESTLPFHILLLTTKVYIRRMHIFPNIQVKPILVWGWTGR